MPFRLLSLEAVAEYLHLTPADIEQRVKNGEIPFEKRGHRIVFRKADIDAWASQRILGSTSRQLTDYHTETTRFTRKVLAQETILPQMLQAGAIASAMSSKTKASVLRDLVALAEKTGHLNDPKMLLASLEGREELCSTAVPGGFALPHPRAHDLTCLTLHSSWWAGPSRKSISARPTASRHTCFSWSAARMTACICTRWRGCV